MQILDVWLDLEAPADDWTLSIPIEGIEVVVKGQGLATEQAWDGLIVCEDSLSRLSIAAIGGIKELEDSVSVSLVLPENISPNESISRIGFDGVAVRQISEQVGIYLTSISHNLVTAQGDNIMTADGNDNIVTKG